jgi:hypothetical protein
MTLRMLTILVALLALLGGGAPPAAARWADPPPAQQGSGTTLYIPVVNNSYRDPQASPIQILPGYTSYFDGLSQRRVVGEILNTSPQSYQGVSVRAIFYDNGQVVASNESLIFLPVLAAYERTCFDVAVLEPPTWQTYDVQVSAGQPYPNLPISLQLTGQVGFYDSLSNQFVVTGTIYNADSVPASNVTIAITLLNSSGDVLDCGFGVADISLLDPGQDTGFSVTIAKNFTPGFYEAAAGYFIQIAGERAP